MINVWIEIMKCNELQLDDISFSYYNGGDYKGGDYKGGDYIDVYGSGLSSINDIEARKLIKYLEEFLRDREER